MAKMAFYKTYSGLANDHILMGKAYSSRDFQRQIEVLKGMHYYKKAGESDDTQKTVEEWMKEMVVFCFAPVRAAFRKKSTGEMGFINFDDLRIPAFSEKQARVLADAMIRNVETPSYLKQNGTLEFTGYMGDLKLRSLKSPAMIKDFEYLRSTVKPIYECEESWYVFMDDFNSKYAFERGLVPVGAILAKNKDIYLKAEPAYR